MPKNVLQDVIPTNKKSIRNIPVPDRNSREERKLSVDVEKPKKSPYEGYEAPIRMPSVSSVSDETIRDKYVGNNTNGGRGGKSFSKNILWGVAILCAAGLVFAVLSFFNTTTVKVALKQQSVPIEVSLTAKKIPTAGEVAYQVAKVSMDMGEVAQATGEERVEKKASGTIVVYNNYSGENQRLITNTRFETPEGLIYRINKSIVVPGKKTVNGESVPGSIEVEVFADNSGEKYNIGLTDFTIPGFKGDPRYKDFYARSKTKMTGGFVGVVKKVADSDLKKTQNSVDSKLTKELVKQAKSEAPQGFVLYENGFTFSFEDLPQSDASANSVKVNRRGTAYGIMLNASDITKQIGTKTGIFSDKESVRVLNISDLTFTLNSKDWKPDMLEDTPLDFDLKGNASLLWTYDQTSFKNDLLNKSKKDMPSILAKYPAIQIAEPIFRPFWKSTFPKTTNKIKIEETIKIQ